jgi:cardiolipin synthase
MKHNGQRTRLIVLIAILAILVRVLYEVIINQLSIQFPFQQFFTIASTWLINIIAVLIWINIVLKSDYSVAKLPWLLILIIEPFTGIFFFLTFGRDYRESGRYHKHILFQNGAYLKHEPLTDFDSEELKRIDSEVTDIFKTAYNMTKHHAYTNDSKATVLKNGVTFFPTLKEQLLSATDFILMQFYIIRPDTLGNEIFDILKQKSLGGVEVKVLYDSLGSYTLTKKDIESLKSTGIEVEEIDPVLFGVFDTRVNYRNHRKQVIIDGTYAFIGGMNLADEYLHKIKRAPEFRDTTLMLEGCIVNSVTALFFRDWYSTTDQFISDKDYYCAKPVTETGLIQLIPSGPDFKYPPIRNTYVKLINNAKKSIKIMTPYLALDHEMVTSLIIAARSGVLVEIIVPGVPDKKVIYEVTQSYFEDLLEEGVKIYKFNKKFTHAKVLIMDDMIASCGTYNLDNRSARINYEATLLLYQQGVPELVQDFSDDLDQSEEVLYDIWKRRNTFKKLIEGVISIIAPLV